MSAGICNCSLEASNLRISAAQRNREIGNWNSIWIRHLAHNNTFSHKDEVAGGNFTIAGKRYAGVARTQPSVDIKGLQRIRAKRQRVKAEAAVTGRADLTELRPDDLDRRRCNRSHSINIQHLAQHKTCRLELDCYGERLTGSDTA